MKLAILSLGISIHKHIVSIGTVILSLLVPIQMMLLLVFVIVLLDTAAGIWSAYRQGIPITSRRFSSIITKLLVYKAIIIATYMFDVILLGEFIAKLVDINLAATKVITIILVMTEVFSIDEKFIRATGKGSWYYIQRVLKLTKRIHSETKKLSNGNERHE